MRRSSAALHFAHSADPGSSVLLLNEDNVFVAHKGRLPFLSLITKPRTRASIARTSEPRRQPSQKPPDERFCTRQPYHGSPMASARNRFSGSIDSHVSRNDSKNWGVVTWLSRNVRVAVKSFRRRSWMNGWFGSYPGGGRCRDSPSIETRLRNTFFQVSGSSTIRSRIFFRIGASGCQTPDAAIVSPERMWR